MESEEKYSLVIQYLKNKKIRIGNVGDITTSGQVEEILGRGNSDSTTLLKCIKIASFYNFTQDNTEVSREAVSPETAALTLEAKELVAKKEQDELIRLRSILSLGTIDTDVLSPQESTLRQEYLKTYERLKNSSQGCSSCSLNSLRQTFITKLRQLSD